MPQLIACALTVAAVLVVLVVPGYTVARSSSDGEESIHTVTVLEYLGPWILAVLALPVIVSAMPLLVPFRWRPAASIASACSLALFGLLGAATIGGYFVPAICVSIAALFLPEAADPGGTPSDS